MGKILLDSKTNKEKKAMLLQTVSQGSLSQCVIPFVLATLAVVIVAIWIHRGNKNAHQQSRLEVIVDPRNRHEAWYALVTKPLIIDLEVAYQLSIRNAYPSRWELRKVFGDSTVVYYFGHDPDKLGVPNEGERVMVISEEGLKRAKQQGESIYAPQAFMMIHKDALRPTD